MQNDECEQFRSACGAAGSAQGRTSTGDGPLRDADEVAHARPAAHKPLSPGNQPNIVLILTDDFSFDLVDYSMPKLDSGLVTRRVRSERFQASAILLSRAFLARCQFVFSGVIRYRFIFSGKNDELTPDFRQLTPDFRLGSSFRARMMN